MQEQCSGLRPHVLQVGGRIADRVRIEPPPVPTVTYQQVTVERRPGTLTEREQVGAELSHGRVNGYGDHVMSDDALTRAARAAGGVLGEVTPAGVTDGAGVKTPRATWWHRDREQVEDRHGSEGAASWVNDTQRLRDCRPAEPFTNGWPAQVVTL